MRPRPTERLRARQQAVPGRWVPWLAVLASFAGSSARAVDLDAGNGQRQWSLVPSVSVTETFTDNLLLSGTDRVSDGITRLTAGLDFSARTAQLRASLGYSLSELLHARHHERNTSQNTLNAGLNADFLDGRGKLDANASISQTAVSAFGTQPAQDGRPTQNTTELRAIQVSPSLSGYVGSALRYSASVGLTATDAAKTTIGDVTTTTAALMLSPAQAGLVGWRLDATHTTSDYKQGRVTEDNRVNGVGTMRLDALDAEWHVSGGVEQTNLSSAQRDTYRTWGAGGSWTPSNRTKLTLDLDKRFFGRSHTLVLEHRTPLTVWRLLDSRSLSTSGAGQTAVGGQGTAYDLFFAQLASREPDPVKRDALVRALLEQLGISPQRGINLGFLSSAVTLQDRKEASVAINGVRSALVVAMSRSRTSRLDTVAPAQGDLGNSPEITMQGLTMDFSHRLAPMSSLNLTWSDQRGSGVQAAQASRQRQVGLVYSTRPSSITNLSMGWRRALYISGTVAPYDESSLFATYGVRF